MMESRVIVAVTCEFVTVGNDAPHQSRVSLRDPAKHEERSLALVRCEDIEAHVRSLDCVEFVTQLSLLHVAQSDEHVYTLSDTARGLAELATRARPRSPWSIALPMREHMLRTVDTATDERPEVTGIDRLGVGNTFIIGGVAS